jgi:hypothetical protein
MAFQAAVMQQLAAAVKRKGEMIINNAHEYLLGSRA